MNIVYANVLLANISSIIAAKKKSKSNEREHTEITFQQQLQKQQKITRA